MNERVGMMHEWSTGVLHDDQEHSTLNHYAALKELSVLTGPKWNCNLHHPHPLFISLMLKIENKCSLMGYVIG